MARSAKVLLACFMLSTTAAIPALSQEKVFNNSRIDFSGTNVEVLAGGFRPALARLSCSEGFRFGGYQFVFPITPVPSYPENWAPIVITKADYSVVNLWTLELANKAEEPRDPFPLTIGFVCVETSKSQ